MEKYVNAIRKSCYCQIRSSVSIRPCITTEACTTLVPALVISWLDYGNALLYGISLIPLTIGQMYSKERAHNAYFAAVTIASGNPLVTLLRIRGTDYLKRLYACVI